MATQIIENFTNKLQANPPPSKERKEELIIKCLKVCASLAPLIYLNRIHSSAIIDFAQTYTHQLSAEAFEQASPYLAIIVNKYNTNSLVDFVFIRGFNDKYLLTDETPLGAAIKARNEDEIITILSTIPTQDLKYIGKSHMNLLSILTKLLFAKVIQHLAAHVTDAEFDDLYMHVKDEFTETPIDNLSSRIYKTTEQMAKARSIIKIFIMKGITIIDEDKNRLKHLHIFPSMPAALHRIKTRRGEHRTPTKRAVPYPDAYFILGHGGDYNFHTTFRVPKDCAIIAKATSGQLLIASKTDALAPIYDLHTKPYINPLKKDNLLYLIDKYKYFSLFTEHSYYPNFTYTLLSVFPIEEYYRLGYSGVIKHPFRTSEGEIIETVELMNTVHILKSDKLSAHIEKFLNSYKYSIYPKKQVVHDLINEYISENPDITVQQFVEKAEREPNNIINVSQQFLFNELTDGIYYNFVCRASLFTNKLYQNGFVLDDSMRGLIREGSDNIEVRGGLRQIISEALTTRAGIIKAAMKAANVGANNESASVGLAASASAASVASPSIASHFVKMRSMIIKLRQKFSNEKFFEFIEYLQPRVHSLLGSVTDEVVIENQRYLSENLPEFFEKLTNVCEHYITIIKFLNELYYNGHIVMEGGDPSYLKQLDISDELETYINQQTNDALIARFKHKPIYVLEYMKNGELMTLFHIAIHAHKYKFAHWLFEKTPRIAYAYVPMFNIRPFYFDLLKIKGPYVPAYEPLRDIVSKINDFIKPIFVIGQLKKDMTADARARYKIFEPYILERQLHIQHPEIADTMRQFGMLAAPQSTLAQRLAALRAQIPKNLSNSNNNSPGKGKKTYKKYSSNSNSSNNNSSNNNSSNNNSSNNNSSNSNKSSNKKKTVKSHSKSNSSNSE